ncbi:MAG: MMPL family transporter, partial [Gammaproteobacteria bacterium]|nr:MMPL family transporter [Gammaproteobacteria bacterium]
TPKAAAQQTTKEQADWQGNKWLSADGSAKLDPNKPDPNFAGNKWVNTDGTPKDTAQQAQKEQADWQGNKWLNADGTAKVDPNKADPNFSGNKWVNTDGTPKPVAAEKTIEEAGWGGNKWVNADGSAKTNPDQPDPNFAGNKWVNTDGTPKPAAQQKVKQEADWQGNKWLSAEGKPKTDPNKADPEWAGNKWVSAEGTPKPVAAQSEKVEKDWQGNKWLTAEGKAKEDVEFTGNKWVSAEGKPKPAIKKKEIEEKGWAGNKWVNADGTPKKAGDGEVIPKAVNDAFYLSGRPVIEVSSGLYAMEDMQLMVPMLIAAMAIVLLIIFRTWRGMLLPIAVMSIAIVWTFGLMVLLNVPLYTISTMLPVILVAVGIGDAVHLLSAYYDKVLHNPQSDAKSIVSEATLQLGPPLIMTSVTTAIGFLALTFAEMPPFRIFGVFALIGILFSWAISVTLLPAVLTLLKPQVGNYLAKRRALRVYEEQDKLSLFLTNTGRWIENHRKGVFAILTVVCIVALYGTSKLYVDSSWMSDFKPDTDIAQANAKVNEKFSGTIFLNTVIEADSRDAFKDPVLLHKIEALQDYVKTLPYVGDSISVVDYIKSMNKVLHSGDEKYNVIPDSRAQIAEYLFLFSVSGRPQQLDEVVDFNYQKGLVTIIIKTDHTKQLKHIIDSVKSFSAKEFKDMHVDVNLSGSGNNSYIWAKLLIDSQTTAIVLSKVAILFVAALVFMSFIAGVYVVIPVTVSTLLVAGVAGLLSIPLDVSTALAAGIAIGVGVDYAVHFVFRYIRERRKYGEHMPAMEHTLRSTGHTIVLNAVVVSVGFAVLFFSNFPPHQKLGYFVTAYMVVSCLVAIWVLPAIISYFKPSFSQQDKT